ncbi:methylated-DNA--[protein]-cysteine S-methyltransferase [Streptococcus constellatus]|uniref:methylated-DNA--[protein]-cysteine S-methyltransferase n=1 Tax=Streptococcus anginosus group TaxID=671232 RepID=UPI000E3CEFDE|nr:MULTISPECIES: methylated-DNA--[protein]-cysteine S-methyltransferase [Streptococcus anginosus group]RID95540.1 methylated-DNA--[protein]-cysteine S-methyltransferase [Streptococcus constellatus]
MIFYKQMYPSPLGEMSLVANESGLVGVWFLQQKYFEHGLEEGNLLLEKNDVLKETELLLEHYFSGDCPDFSSLLLASVGTNFQQQVWAYLQTIPYGETVTYGQIAKKLGNRSAQAVGGAVGRNPFSIIVPCHRVLGSQGQLTGYAGGLDKKRWLLEHEGVELNEKDLDK